MEFKNKAPKTIKVNWNRSLNNLEFKIQANFNKMMYKLIKKWKTIFSIKIENKHHKILILLQTLKT